MKDVMALCWAASQGDLDEIKRLVATGVDLNGADYDGRTCLHLAASEGQKSVVNYLLAKQVDINLKDRFGGTPLADAKRHNQDEVVLILEKSVQKYNIIKEQ